VLEFTRVSALARKLLCGHETVKMLAHTQTKLGDLVVAAYDEAARYASDPREVSRLANQIVLRLLNARPSRRRPTRLRARV
jgi:hypothetical protein